MTTCLVSLSLFVCQSSRPPAFVFVETRTFSHYIDLAARCLFWHWRDMLRCALEMGAERCSSRWRRCLFFFGCLWITLRNLRNWQLSVQAASTTIGMCWSQTWLSAADSRACNALQCHRKSRPPRFRKSKLSGAQVCLMRLHLVYIYCFFFNSFCLLNKSSAAASDCDTFRRAFSLTAVLFSRLYSKKRITQRRHFVMHLDFGARATTDDNRINCCAAHEKHR